MGCVVETPQRLPGGRERAHGYVGLGGAHVDGRLKALAGHGSDGARLSAEAPASTCQEATAVAPFQLASTVTVPPARGLHGDRRRGGGRALHGER